MSNLIEEHSDHNRVIDTALAVRYSKVRITGLWSYNPTQGVTTTYSEAWSFTRTASKMYRYVGMTKAAADACATAMREKYQRNTKYSRWRGGTYGEFDDVSGGNMPMADVAVNRVGGAMYEVVISVNETDACIRISDASYASLFATENQRDYDE